jgi:hypothetical protein
MSMRSVGRSLRIRRIPRFSKSPTTNNARENVCVPISSELPISVRQLQALLDPLNAIF